jgi:hypothetical protein
MARSIERIEKVFPKRQYFLDIDRYFQVRDARREIHDEFDNISGNTGSVKYWIDFVSELDYATPCILLSDKTIDQIKQQIEAFQNHGKGFAVRIERQFYPRNIGAIVSLLNEIGTADFCIILDGGWVPDALQLYAEFDGLISNALSTIDAAIPIVVSCTTFPNDFSRITGVVPVEFKNRELVSQIARNNNRRTIVYGDWGSTRPRQYERFGQPLPRIDYAGSHSWFFARNKEEYWSYKDAAKNITKQKAWLDSFPLGVWGENQIVLTCTSESQGISTPQQNVASRVNIHLHRQAFYDVSVSLDDLDEDWED